MPEPIIRWILQMCRLDTFVTFLPAKNRKIRIARGSAGGPVESTNYLLQNAPSATQDRPTRRQRAQQINAHKPTIY
ncbi:hypothetical protein D5038_19745 [Verminephrobacter aporrectodeae subsp. tuberculatae]|nr:hypothetical protein [Verminephrobacter aporrectodeae subsp. tuberculatae]